MEAVGGPWALLLLLLLLVAVLKLALPRTRAGGRLPPGPTPLPLLGNLLQLRPGAFYSGFLQLSKKYGPVFTVHLGPWRRVVVLVGHKAVREALGDHAEEFNGRGTLTTLERTFDGHGIFFSNGERWRQLRKLTLHALRDLGMGKREGEELIQAEARCLVEAFQEMEGQPFNPSMLLAQTTSNVICSLAFGLRFPYTDKEFQAVVQASVGTLLGMSSPWGQLYEMFSWFLEPLPGPHKQLLGHLNTLATFVVQQIKQHQKNLDPSGPAQDIIDVFLLKIAQEEKDPNTEITEKNLLMTVTYLLFSGTVTISATVSYALLLLLKYPEVQERVHEELTRELGGSRPPSLGDRSRLPYTDAVLHEVLRLQALIPMGVPRALTRTTCFRGYTIPKGTEVFPLIGSILHDPEVFERPEEFNPGRFLDEEGRFKKQEAFLPFSLGICCVPSLPLPTSWSKLALGICAIWGPLPMPYSPFLPRGPRYKGGRLSFFSLFLPGKRVCLGEGLVRTEVFLLFTAILQRFSLDSVCPPEDLSLQPVISGFANIPPAFQLLIRSR